MDTSRSLLVTGSSSGIGLACARHMRDRGWRVFASCRAETDCARLRAEGFEAPRLDYADPDSVAAGLAAVLEATGGRLDALYNNGAYALPGAVEDLPLGPPGEYAQSCVGRERMFQHFSTVHGTPGRLIRLNYAIDMRYGVLEDIGRKVFQGEPVDVATGNVNFIWQGDANAQILRALGFTPPPGAAR